MEEAMEKQPEPLSSKPSETVEECLILDQVLYRLTSQWAIDQSKMAAKRMELLNLLREVGEPRFLVGVVNAIQNWDSEFCPPVSIIRLRYVPSEATDEQKATMGDRRALIRQQAEERRKRYELDYLARKAAKL